GRGGAPADLAPAAGDPGGGARGRGAGRTGGGGGAPSAQAEDRPPPRQPLHHRRAPARAARRRGGRAGARGAGSAPRAPAGGARSVYGDQRFGIDGDNAAAGRALVRGERPRGKPREARFLVSAYQSALFNRFLEERMKDGLYLRVIEGDLLKKVETGGLFATT